VKRSEKTEKQEEEEPEKEEEENGRRRISPLRRLRSRAKRGKEPEV